MANVASFNDIVNRVGGKFFASETIYNDIPVATTTPSSNLQSCQRVGYTKALPALDTGVSGYFVSEARLLFSASNGTYMVAKLINLGSLDISGASGTFTDGSAMPTVTELGVSRQIYSGVLIEVTTTLNATPGAFTITYVDQDGNGAETTTSRNLGASAAAYSVGFAILNDNDIGVQDITAAARSAGTTPTGVIQFWGVIPIQMGVQMSLGTVTGEGCFAPGFNMPKLGATDQIGVFGWNVTNARGIVGDIYYIGDST